MSEQKSIIVIDIKKKRKLVPNSKLNQTAEPTAATAATPATAIAPLSHREQVLIVNQLFLNYDVPCNPQLDFYKSLITKKCAGYKQQDVANTIYDPNWFITTDEVLDLLVASKLLCYYCRKACYIHYTEPLCPDQWTLERISNDHGHNRNNVVIACLKCNLNRGTKSSDRFKLGKQLRFVKV